MNNLDIERRKIDFSSLSAEIARHIQDRIEEGKVCVVTDRPKDLMSAVRKQWHKIIRKVQRQHADTLDARKILACTQQIAHMQQMEFVANPPDDFIGVNIGFVTPSQVLRYAPDCRTMYVACTVQRDKLHFMTAMMWPGSLVVIYEQKS
jgi:hypothetical protein